MSEPPIVIGKWVCDTTGTTTQDLVVSGFTEIPKGAIIAVYRNTVLGTLMDGNFESIGYVGSDGSAGLNSHAVYAQQEDGDAAGPDNSSGSKTGTIIKILDQGSTSSPTVEGEASCDSFIAGGLRISWSNNPSSAYTILGYFYFGDHITTRCGSDTPSSTSLAVNVGFKPHIIHLGTSCETINKDVNNARFSLGVVTINHTDDSIKMLNRFRREATAASSYGRNSSATSRCLSQFTFSGGGDWFCTVSSVSATGWSYSFTAAPNKHIFYLAVHLGGGGAADCGAFLAPTTLSEETISTNRMTTGIPATTYGFTPIAAGFFPSYATSLGTLTQGPSDTTSSIPLGFATYTTEYCGAAIQKGGVSTSDTKGLAQQCAGFFPDGLGTVLYEFNFLDGDDESFTLDFIDVAPTSTYVLWWAIKQIGETVSTSGVLGPTRQATDPHVALDWQMLTTPTKAADYTLDKTGVFFYQGLTSFTSGVDTIELEVYSDGAVTPEKLIINIYPSLTIETRELACTLTGYAPHTTDKVIAIPA